jgi:hypothetical protein
MKKAAAETYSYFEYGISGCCLYLYDFIMLIMFDLIIQFYFIVLLIIVDNL